jgi:hypothetical protein
MVIEERTGVRLIPSKYKIMIGEVDGGSGMVIECFMSPVDVEVLCLVKKSGKYPSYDSLFSVPL